MRGKARGAQLMLDSIPKVKTWIAHVVDNAKKELYEQPEEDSGDANFISEAKAAADESDSDNEDSEAAASGKPCRGGKTFPATACFFSQMPSTSKVSPVLMAAFNPSASYHVSCHCFTSFAVCGGGFVGGRRGSAGAGAVTKFA